MEMWVGTDQAVVLSFVAMMGYFVKVDCFRKQERFQTRLELEM